MRLRGRHAFRPWQVVIAGCYGRGVAWLGIGDAHYLLTAGSGPDPRKAQTGGHAKDSQAMEPEEKAHVCDCCGAEFDAEPELVRHIHEQGLVV